MGSIYKRGKVWYIDVRENGRRVRRKVGTSKKVAELTLKDTEVKIARDEFGFTKKNISIESFLDKFLEYSQTNHSRATQKRYRAVVDHFRRYLEERKSIKMLSQIDQKEIEDYKTFRKSEWVNPNGDRVEAGSDVTEFTRKGAKAHTVNFEVNTMKTMLNLAVKWDYLKANPASEVKRLKTTDSKLPRLLTKEECKRFLDHCPVELEPIFFTFLSTGMRRGELVTLTWDDVDFKRRKLLIRRKQDWNPKSGEREIPMNESVLTLFERLKKENDKGKQSHFVFPGRSGNKLKVDLRVKLIKIAEDASIPNLTKVHSLRHAFASHLVMNGVDLPTVQKLMGHADIQTTMIYSHLAPDHLTEAVEKLQF